MRLHIPDESRIVESGLETINAVVEITRRQLDEGASPDTLLLVGGNEIYESLGSRAGILIFLIITLMARDIEYGRTERIVPLGEAIERLAGLNLPNEVLALTISSGILAIAQKRRGIDWEAVMDQRAAKVTQRLRMFPVFR